MGGLADVSLDSDDDGPWPAPLQPDQDGPSIDLREDDQSPPVPTGAWGRPVTLWRPVEARPAPREVHWPGIGLTGPQPSPPGARSHRRGWASRPRRALVEGAIAVALIGVLAYAFAPRVPHPGWAVQGNPVVQSLLDDVAALSRSAGAAPPGPVVAALGSDLARSRRLGPPADPATARLWAGAVAQLQEAYAAIRGSGTVGPQVRAELTSAGDALLELALQH